MAAVLAAGAPGRIASRLDGETEPAVARERTGALKDKLGL